VPRPTPKPPTPQPTPRPNPTPTPNPTPKPNPGEPQPNPQPNPGQPQPSPAPKEQVNKEITWRELEPLQLTQQVLRETKFFKHFKEVGDKSIEDLEFTKPIIVFFYAPDDVQGNDAEKKKKITKELADLFNSDTIKSHADQFHWFKCDVTKLDKAMLAFYLLSGYPCVMIVDLKGIHFWHSSGDLKVDYFEKKIVAALERCDLLRKMKEKEASK